MMSKYNILAAIVATVIAIFFAIVGRNRALKNKVDVLVEDKKEEVKNEELKSLTDDALLSRLKRILKRRTKNN